MRLEYYIIILLQIESIFAIRCYKCTGKFDRKQQSPDPCVNPAENVGDGNVEEVDCLSSKLCWKAIAGGKIRRGCGEKRCAFIPDVNLGSLISQTCCPNDLCNQTTSNKNISKWIVYFLIFLLYFIQ